MMCSRSRLRLAHSLPITGDGSVVTWGDPGDGGDSSAVQEQLKDVQQIQFFEFRICCHPG